MLLLNLNHPSYRIFAGSNKNLKTGIPYASPEIQDEVVRAAKRLVNSGFTDLTGPKIAAEASKIRPSGRIAMHKSTVYAVTKILKIELNGFKELIDDLKLKTSKPSRLRIYTPVRTHSAER